MANVRTGGTLGGMIGDSTQPVDIPKWLWVNGKVVAEGTPFMTVNEAQGFVWGCFDTTRTFNGTLFRMKEHMARYFESMRALSLTSPYSEKEWVGACEDLVRRNAHMLDDGRRDVWVYLKIAPAVSMGGGLDPARPKVTCIVQCAPLPYSLRAKGFKQGIDIALSAIRRPSPDTQSPRMKAFANYPNMTAAGRTTPPGTIALQLDHRGFVCECVGLNIFLVKNGEVLTPLSQFVLGGISRLTVLELARQIGVPAREADLDTFDLAVADEVFITSTSWCICGVRSVDGRQLSSAPQGAITRRLMDAYKRLTSCDFEKQYLDQLPPPRDAARL